MIDLATKYSIIIPYRDRSAHLETLLPRLQDLFQEKDYEIIISEQNDKENFRIACVENIGFQHATGDVIILHQVDYYPTDDVSYEVFTDPVLPVVKGIFLDKDNVSPRDYSDIPGGYRNWEHKVDPAFYGGVICMKRAHFEAINGLNPMYKGWGNEDEDLRERFKWVGIPVTRNTVGTFLCLYHTDNGDIAKKEVSHQDDFYQGRKYFYEQAYKDKHLGYRQLSATVEEFTTGINNVRWIKSTDYNINLN